MPKMLPGTGASTREFNVSVHQELEENKRTDSPVEILKPFEDVLLVKKDDVKIYKKPKKSVVGSHSSCDSACCCYTCFPCYSLECSLCDKCGIFLDKCEECKRLKRCEFCYTVPKKGKRPKRLFCKYKILAQNRARRMKARQAQEKKESRKNLGKDSDEESNSSDQTKSNNEKIEERSEKSTNGKERDTLKMDNTDQIKEQDVTIKLSNMRIENENTKEQTNQVLKIIGDVKVM